jgi:RimJ/RimL family protein N-acetyltransferase
MTQRAALLRREGTVSGKRYLVRPSQSEDARALAELRDLVAAEGDFIAAVPGEHSSLEEELAMTALVSEGGLTLTLEVDGAITGHLMVRRRRGPRYSHGGEIAIIVHNAQRGFGFGRMMMEMAIDWAGAVGINKLSLAVFPDNARAIGLYRSLGFVEEGVARAEVRMPDGQRDLLLMALLL